MFTVSKLGHALEKGSALCRSSAQRCAWGLGSDCMQCPEGAKCRGAYAVETFRGYFIAEMPGPGNSPSVQQCPPPAQERCRGGKPSFSNPMSHLSQCSTGYSGRFCKICVGANAETSTRAYYQTSGKLCKPCPSESHSELLETAGPFVAFLTAAFLLVALAVWRLEIATNYSRSSPIAHENGKVWVCAFTSSKDFCVWTFSSFQILATASTSEVPGVPALVTKVYEFVSLFNLDTR